MRIRIIAVGRAKRGPETSLFDVYRSRITWSLELIEVEEKRPLPTDQRIAREEELIRAKIPDGATIVALDETAPQNSRHGRTAALVIWCS